MQGMTNAELQFQIAVRDQIIQNQREAQSNLWVLLVSSGLNHKQILELATKQGITIEDWIMPPGSPVLRKQSPVPISARYPQFLSLPRSPMYESHEKSNVTPPRNHPCEFMKLESSNNKRNTQINNSSFRGMDYKPLEYRRPDMRNLNQLDGTFSRTSEGSPTEVGNGICTMRQEHHSSF